MRARFFHFKTLQKFANFHINILVWSKRIFQIEKLKTREKYERHFILLSVLYSEMVKIRKICESAFESLSEIGNVQIDFHFVR